MKARFWTKSDFWNITIGMYLVCGIIMFCVWQYGIAEKSVEYYNENKKPKSFRLGIDYLTNVPNNTVIHHDSLIIKSNWNQPILTIPGHKPKNYDKFNKEFKRYAVWVKDEHEVYLLPENREGKMIILYLENAFSLANERVILMKR